MIAHHVACGHDAILLLCFPVLHRVEASGSESKMNSSLECIPAASGEQQVAREVDNTPSSSRMRKSGSLEAPVLTSWSERRPLRCWARWDALLPLDHW
ncbi:hypothetical protein B0H14DRAFT_2832483 [Mycena olivaceomarginata]|nr:hypothetical protein B0H14DRAFT_2832483 [Mycena olivaceomarginata]